MIRIKALNEDVDTSDSETEEPENGLLTREAQEENLQQLYCEALKLVDSDKEQAKSELISLLDTLDEFDESSGLTNIVHLKYLSLKNLGLLFPDNLNYFLDALAIDGGDVTLWIETGRRALNQFTNLPLARTCFEEAHRISPTNWVVLDILMGLYYVLNDYSNCLKLAIKGLTKDCHYFKACLLISEMVKHFPSIGSELPVNLQYLHNWNPCEKDLERKEKILAEFSNLKEKRKRKFLEDETNQNDGRKVFTLNLESTSLSSLQSLTSTLKKIYTEMEKANCPRSTFISIESGTSSDDVQSADENMSDEYSDKEKLNNKPEKRGSFPFEFIDKRRSSRVQKIQNKTSDSCEF
ncbi:calcineurin-binding protein cabin-1-like [Panonychus citri]|nr:calcineurin-binding protein cabin-1-like [Panonychus citri]